MNWKTKNKIYYKENLINNLYKKKVISNDLKIKIIKKNIKKIKTSTIRIKKNVNFVLLKSKFLKKFNILKKEFSEISSYYVILNK